MDWKLADGRILLYGTYTTQYFWPGSDIFHTLVYANVSMALCRMMIRGKWTFDGDGYLNHRIGQSFKVQAWREEASSRLDALLQRAKITK